MKLGIASPEVLIRKGLCSLLAGLPDVCVVVDLDCVLERSQFVQQLRLDALLIHTANPANGLRSIPPIKKLLPQVKLILLIDDANEDLELQAIRAGVLACVSKKAEPHVLGEALKAVASGEHWMSRRASARIIGGFMRGEDSGRREAGELTQREREILALTAKGYSNKEMASRLFVSENTIKTHLVAIYRKLGVAGRMGAAMHYFQGAVLSEIDAPLVGSLTQMD
jgi:two-component system, NarL family, response regulator NreC